MFNAKILVVEDESSVAIVLQYALEHLGYTVSATASSGEEAVKKALETHPDLVLMDINLQGKIDGIEAASQIFSRCNIPVVYLTGYRDDDTLARAMVTKPFGYIFKPFEERELCTTIEVSLGKHQTQRKLAEHDQWLTTILSGISDGVIATDVNRLVTFMNQIAETLTGWKQEDAMGREVAEVFQLMNEHNRVRVESLASSAIQDKTTTSRQNYILLTKDGAEIPIDHSAGPLKDHLGIQGTVFVFRDISERKQAEENLQKSEESFQNLTVNVKDYAIFAMDTEARIFSWNLGAERLLGYSESEVLGQHYSMLFRPEDVALGADQEEINTALRDGRGEEARWHQRKNGSQFWTSEILNPLRDNQGELQGFSKIMRDITDRKRTEEALEKIQKRLELAQQAGKIGTFEWDFQTNTFIATPELESVYGLAPGSFGGSHENWLQRLLPEDQVRAETEVTSAATTGRFDTEYRILWPDGSLHWIAAKAQVFKDDAGNPLRMIGVNVDISDRKQAEEQLKASLAEKEVLLKEIHHRVKNNLQVIRSLLNLQSRYIQDQESRVIFKESQDRIDSMALIHEKLYQSEDLARVGFDEYVRDLTTNLFGSYNVRSESISLKLNLHKVSLKIDLAIPCGFIVNELITNSLKHAFPGGRTGEICINLHLAAQNNFVLSVSDNGIGFPKDLDFQNTQSLGLQLVNTLAKQLRGTVKLNRQGGTEFTLTFPA